MSLFICISTCFFMYMKGLFFSLPSVVFWFGDLNFRIEDYDIHVVKCAIDSSKLPLLWERDQVSHLHHFKTFIHSQRQMDFSGKIYTTCLSLDYQPRQQRAL